MSKNTKLGLSIENMKSYKYCGGNTIGRHLNYWKLFNKNNKYPQPSHTNKCKCGHHIEENCYVIDKNTEDIVVLGNCCIQKFCPDNNNRTCEICNEKHKNRVVNRCNKCRLGKCDICDKKCNDKYSTCYECKFKDEKNFTCDNCGESLSSKFEICECKKKFIISNGVQINVCIECDKSIDIKYNKCFICNNKNKINKCKHCDKNCDPQYETCFSCKDK